MSLLYYVGSVNMLAKFKPQTYNHDHRAWLICVTFSTISKKVLEFKWVVFKRSRCPSCEKTGFNVYFSLFKLNVDMLTKL